MDLPISERMTKEGLVTCRPGTTLEQAKQPLHEHRIEKLLVVDKAGNLKGLITVKDIQKQIKYPNACKDSLGRLRVGAAVGVAADTLERVAALVDSKVDVVVVDTAHGHSTDRIDRPGHTDVSSLRSQNDNLDLIPRRRGRLRG